MNRQVVIITGKTGYGKSTWLTAYCKRFERICAFDPFAKFQADYLTEQEILDGQKVIFHASKFRIATFRLEDLELLGATAYIVGNSLLIIEECGYAFQKGERIPDWLSEIVFLGRHKNVGLVVTAQRAASIPIDLRSQANRLITFNQTETNDVNWMENYLGERMNEVPVLPRYECLDSDDNNISRYSVHPDM